MEMEEEILAWVRKHYESSIRSERTDEIMCHIIRVGDIAKDIFKVLNKADENALKLVIAGAYLHDVEKLNEDEVKENHHKLGKGFLKEEKQEDKLKSMGFDKEERKIIQEMVRYHKKGKLKKGTRDVDLENKDRDVLVKIIQDADKISKIYKGKGNCYLRAWIQTFRDETYGQMQRMNIADNITKKGLNFNESYKIFAVRYNEYVKQSAGR